MTDQVTTKPEPIRPVEPRMPSPPLADPARREFGDKTEAKDGEGHKGPPADAKPVVAPSSSTPAL